jgi:hypothetical protein
MYNIRNGVPALDSIHGGIVGRHDGGGGGGFCESGGAAFGGPSGHGRHPLDGHALSGHGGSGGGLHSLPAGPHGALPSPDSTR